MFIMQFIVSDGNLWMMAEVPLCTGTHLAFNLFIVSKDIRARSSFPLCHSEISNITKYQLIAWNKRSRIISKAYI